MIAVNSIKSKVLIFSILATLIPSAGLGLLSYWQNETMIAENVTHQLRMAAIDATRELEFWFGERVDGLRALSSSDAVINGISPPSATSSDDRANRTQILSHYLRLVEEKLDPLLELVALDATGHLVAGSSESPTQITLPDPWPPNAATAGVILDPPHWNETRATATLTIAVPILSLDDTKIGALAAIVDLGSVQSRLDFSSSLSPANVVLLNLEGEPLLSAGTPLNKLSAIPAKVVRQLIDDFDEPVTYRGTMRNEVLALAQIPRTLPLIVTVERDRNEIYQEWVLVRNLFLSLLAGLTVLVALAGWGIGRSIVKPLERLTRAADRIARGDLSVQLPVVPRDEIGHLTQVFNQMADNVRRSQEEVEAANLTLQKQNQRLEELSVTDGLTGLFNRKKLNDILNEQFALYKRHHHPFAVLLMDIDHFKMVNDTYGHLAGDEVLKSVASTLATTIRSVDYAARYGGEEFIVVLPETATSTARDLAERLCERIRNTRCQFNGQVLSVTLSIGVAEVLGDDTSVAAVLARADNMLYGAKRAGRNRVHCAVETGDAETA